MTRTICMCACVAVVALVLTAGCARQPKPGEALAGLTAQEMKQFRAGRAVFDSVFAPETGLGPLFNANACVECHEDPVAGGVGDEVEVHGTAMLANGFCDPLADLGGPVFQQHTTPALLAALGIDKEPVPPNATTGMRTTPPVLGMGLLDAVPDSTLLALADPEDRDSDGISGRVGRFFDGRVGRFGRKALVPTLTEFNRGAFQAEMGLTVNGALEEGSAGGTAIPPGVDPLPEPELSEPQFQLADAFVHLLAPPSTERLSSSARRGQQVFHTLQCVACHVPVLRTGASPVRALAYRDVHAYSDLLLHDMGPGLADICFGEALPSELRTQPLMGLRFSTQFLHDGRAKSIDDAIRQHGGEATAARDRYAALSDSDRQALLAFLKKL